MALSAPRTKTSRRLAAQEETAGPEPAAMPGDGWPISFTQPLQEVPAHHLWYRLPSVPTPNRSMRLGAQDTAAGLDTMVGPSDCHAPHPVPVHQSCQMALSEPRTN